MDAFGQRIGTSSKLHESRSIVVVVMLAIAAFAGLYALLPPSFILPLGAIVVALAAGLILIRASWWRRQTAVATLVIVAALSLVAERAMAAPASIGIVAPDSPFPEIDALLRDRKFSGAVLVARDGRILLNKGYGYADRNRRIANSPQTRFPIGSVTKQFTAVAILMLQADGKLDVQDPICQYIEGCPTAWHDVTIHHLLTNSSGIPDFFVPCFSDAGAIENAIAETWSQPLLFQPGERWEYSNVGYFLLGKIVEKTAGRPYEIFLQDRMFGPLGMQNTGLGRAEPRAVGYLNGFLPACRTDIGAFYSEGGLYSTVEDLWRWDRALYTEELIPRLLLDSMFTAHITTSEQFLSNELSYGYGWAVGRQFDRQMMMHGGFLPGFTSMIARYPDDRLTVIVLSNQQSYGEGSISAALIQRIFGSWLR